MKILVTGAAGFIGSHLTERLVKDGHEVIAFDRYNSDGLFGWIDHSDVKNDVHKILGDIRDFDSVLNAMQNVDKVFHLAALIGIPYSYVSPQAYVQTNIIGTLNVLQAAKNNGISRVINTSTSETYGSAQFTPITEQHPKVGQSPYSATKISADAIAESFRLSFDMDIRTVRPFNTFGPRQSLRAVIPQIVAQNLSKSEVISLGDTSTIRDMVYVQDTVTGFIKLSEIESWSFSDGINICTGKGNTILEIAETVMELTGISKEIVQDNTRLRPVNSEVTTLIGCSKTLHEETNWSPSTELNDGLLKLIDWMQKNKTEEVGYQI